MMNKKRWRNYALWVNIVSQVLLLIQLLGHLTGLFDLTDVMKQNILTIADVFLGLLATLGIIRTQQNQIVAGSTCNILES